MWELAIKKMSFISHLEHVRMRRHIARGVSQNKRWSVQRSSDIRVARCCSMALRGWMGTITTSNYRYNFWFGCSLECGCDWTFLALKSLQTNWLMDAGNIFNLCPKIEEYSVMTWDPKQVRFSLFWGSYYNKFTGTTRLVKPPHP